MGENKTLQPRIAICETESKGIQHEEVNAAVIDLFIRQQGSAALLYSAADHWRCVDAVHKQRLGTSLPIEHCAIEPPISENKEGSKAEVEKYRELINRLFAQIDAQGIEHVLFTNTHSSGLHAIVECMDKFPHITISMIVHGQLNEHLGLTRFQRWQKKPMLIDLLMAKSCQRIRFFTVSGHIEHSLNSRGLSHLQTASLHHPFLWNTRLSQSIHTDQPENADKKIRICCIGSIHSDKGRRQMRGLVASLAKRPENFELTFFGRFACRTTDDRITIHNRRFDRAEFDELIPGYDFILQPYTENTYQLKASGVLFDALNYEVPILTTSTLFTDYYFDLLGEIGHLANNSTQLLEILVAYIANPDTNTSASMKQNLRAAKTRLSELNQSIIL